MLHRAIAPLSALWLSTCAALVLAAACASPSGGGPRQPAGEAPTVAPEPSVAPVSEETPPSTDPPPAPPRPAFGAAGGPIELAKMDGYAFQLGLDSERVYWADYTGGKGLWRVSRAGGEKQQIAPVNPYARAVALHTSHVYFVADRQADGLGGPPRLFRVAKAGGPVEVVADGVHSDALASDGQRVYWISNSGLYAAASAGAPVLLANVDGTGLLHDHGELFYHRANAIYRISTKGGPEARVAATADLFRGLAADSTSVYWTESGPLVMPPPIKCPPQVPCPVASAAPKMPNGVVKRASLADGSVTTLATSQDSIGEIAVDGAHVYWAASDALRRARKQGGSSDVLVAFQGLGSPHPMAIAEGVLYYAAGARVFALSISAR